MRVDKARLFEEILSPPKRRFNPWVRLLTSPIFVIIILLPFLQVVAGTFRFGSLLEWPALAIITAIVALWIGCGGTNARLKAAEDRVKKESDPAHERAAGFDRLRMPTPHELAAEIAHLRSPIGNVRRAVDRVMQTVLWPFRRFIIPGIRASLGEPRDPLPASRTNSVAFGFVLTLLLHLIVQVPIYLWTENMQQVVQARHAKLGWYIPSFALIWITQYLYVGPAHLYFAASRKELSAHGISLAATLTLLLQAGLCGGAQLIGGRF